MAAEINRLLIKEMNITSFFRNSTIGSSRAYQRFIKSAHLFDLSFLPSELPFVKFFVPILAPFTSSEYTIIKDSFSFVEEIFAIPNANSFVMASIDIKSLFINIPLEETTDIASQNYFNPINQHRFFIRKFFEGLLSLSVKDILFLFNNQLFSQVDGVGMGNPVGPTFAYLFLCHHETNWLNNCSSPLQTKNLLSLC